MVVEMEQMASRPFSVCNIDLPSTVEEPLLRQEYITNMANTRGSQRFKKVRKTYMIPCIIPYSWMLLYPLYECTYGGYYGLVVVKPRPQTFHRSHNNLRNPYRIASIFYM